MSIGFAGLGLMGAPMAANLLRAGAALTVYNRTCAPAAALAALGARVAGSARELFAACDTIILMLADDAAVDEVLARGTPALAERVSGKLIINMGTHSPAWSHALAKDVASAGGRFVEAPVSGSRGPAEAGELVVMLAGDPDAVAEARPIVAPLCRDMIDAGAVPRAMAMKLAVNLYLIASVTALAEATHLAALSGLDLARFASVIVSGPLGSNVARAKLDKMVSRDFVPQAAIRDVVKNARLVAHASQTLGAAHPLLAESLARFETAGALGYGAADMAAILTSYEAA